jgi:hypothetical protein
MTDQEQNTEQEQEFDLANMSDEQVANLDPSSVGDPIQAGDTDPGDQSVAAADADDNETGDTGGAAPVDDSLGASDGGADSNSTDVFADEGNSDQASSEQQQQTAPSHQDEGQGTADSGEGSQKPSEVDYKAEYDKVMAPFRASKREVKVDNVDDVRTLMQKGADYSRKMEAMKPYTRVIKTLEKNGLIDIDKVNFLIDLNNKDEGAIKQFLKDNDIDPMRVDLEGDTNYQPNDHMIGDKELELDTVLDEIRDTPAFARTVETITNQWDTASRQVLMDNPSVIRIINSHISDGYFDQIVDKVANERTFGRLEGLSDLEAYKTVGDAIHEAGGFAPTQSGTSAAGNTDQGFSQDSGSSSADAENLRNRKKAASPTKGSAGTGKPKINLGALTDEQVENLDFSSL